MARPHDIWEFGWLGGYDNRHAYIQSLPENEQEWATMLFHYIDYAFQAEVSRRLERVDRDGLSLNESSDMVQNIRERVKDSLEPPSGDEWRTRFKRDWVDEIFDRKEKDD
jgi:hypothetical protein